MEIEEIERIGQLQGLVAGALAIGGRNCKNADMIAALARGANSRNSLIMDEDVQALAAMSDSKFFNIQSVLCETIPLLDTPSSELMALTSLLVAKGGNDLMANQPNAAFREWCAKRVDRADEVIAAARNGDDGSLIHLVFALEAKGDVGEAFQSAAAEGEERTAGVLALSRMPLDLDTAARAIDVFLELVRVSAPMEAAGLIKAALNIAGKHSTLDRSGIADALGSLDAARDPIAIHLMASALHRHAGEMTDEEITICLGGISQVDPKNGGTIEEIDGALRRLWKDRPAEVWATIAALIKATEGAVGGRALGEILFAHEEGSEREISRLATGWLLQEGFHVCSELASHVSEINETVPCFDIDQNDLPSDPIDQIFVCRKAIGYFFIAPMTAAAWIVAVLRRGGPASDEVAELLFDPLLLNFGGALKTWLEKLLEVEAIGNDRIKAALTRAQDVWNGFDAAREVLELEPSSSQRALVRFREAEQAQQTQEAARKKSIFAQLVTTQTLLYGDRSSFSIIDASGARRPQTVNMAKLSVSIELPRGIIFDPIGTEWLLESFRHERRPTV